MRYSLKREIIKEAVMQNKIHPTAEEVYAIVHKTHPEISMGTVYRDLNQLAEAGEILKLSMADGPDRYDGTTCSHQHASCIKCGKVMDFDYDMSETEKAVLDQTGINPLTCFISVKGICCQCAENI